MTRQETIDLLIELGVIPQPRRCIVQLGRCGDILNILPAVRLLSQQQGQPVPMMVSHQYESVVNGLSYVEPVVFDGDFFEDFHRAVAEAKKQFKDVVVTQMCARDYHFDRLEQHFNLESWRMCGLRDQFHTGRLVLDNRDFCREQMLSAQMLSAKAPNILINLTGKSSPFHAAPTLLHWMKATLPDVNFVDLGQLQAKQVSDLLGLYDRALCLVTIDTATLHLARSHPIPLIAFCAEGWNGTMPAGNVQFRCTYRQVWHHLTTVCEVIRRCVTDGETHPKLIHLQQEYLSKNPDTCRREVVASRTWEPLYASGDVVYRLFDPDDFHNATAVGDRSNAPDVKEVIDRCVRDNPKDWVLLSNNDICILPDSIAGIRAALNKHGCFYSHRIDAQRVETPLRLEDVMDGKHYAGADLFGFTHEWWVKWRDKFPSLFMSFEGWDFVAKALMLQSGFISGEPIIVHEVHETTNWKFQNTRAGQAHNRKVCRKWAMENGFSKYLLPESADFIFKAL